MKNTNSPKNLVAIGLALILIPSVVQGALAERGSVISPVIMQSLLAIGIVIYVVGLCLIAKRRGHSWAWGLTGLCCVVGGVAVLFLKKRGVS